MPRQDTKDTLTLLAGNSRTSCFSATLTRSGRPLLLHESPLQTRMNILSTDSVSFSGIFPTRCFHGAGEGRTECADVLPRSCPPQADPHYRGAGAVAVPHLPKHPWAPGRAAVACGARRHGEAHFIEPFHQARGVDAGQAQKRSIRESLGLRFRRPERRNLSRAVLPACL